MIPTPVRVTRGRDYWFVWFLVGSALLGRRSFELVMVGAANLTYDNFGE